MRLHPELVIGLSRLPVVASKAAVYELAGMEYWVVVLPQQFNGLLEVASRVARKKVSLLLALGVALFRLLPLFFHYYKL